LRDIETIIIIIIIILTAAAAAARTEMAVARHQAAPPRVTIHGHFSNIAN